MNLVFLALFLHLTSVSDSTSSVNDNKSGYEQRLDAGIDAFYKADWDKANRIFGDLKTQYPSEPAPYFFESMMPFLTYFLVEQTDQLANDFLTKSEKALELSHARLEQESTDTTMVLMLSGLYGYRGLIAAGEGDHRIAIQSGMRGFNFTRQLLSIDSNRPDARIGKGMFYYMVGSVPSGMKWAANLLGFKADKEDGFRELKAAANSNSYIRTDAKMMLMFLYQKEDRLDEALYYADQLSKELPDNVIFLFEKANILEKMNNKSAAIRIYTRIVNKNNPDLGLITEKSVKKIKELEKIGLK